MIRFLLRIEGVNFDATLYDTSDLSTIRGASLALLRADKVVSEAIRKHGGTDVALIYSGASQAVFAFNSSASDENAKDVVTGVYQALSRPPYEFLSFVVNAFCVTTTDADVLAIVEARNRTSQFRRWTIDLPTFDEATREYDERDQMRPASAKIRVAPRARTTVLPSENSNDEAGFEECLASNSVAARRDYGRMERQGFYRSEVPEAAAGLRFVDSFGDIVGDAPDKLPLSLSNKIAVIYADGNSFTKIRGGDIEAIQKFAAELKTKRNALLTEILNWFRRGIDAPEQRRCFAAPDFRKDDIWGLRFETLLWGGDEFRFVMPSWLALRFVEGFFRLTRNWDFLDQRLTHSVGAVICHHKTPIRQVNVISEALAKTCKSAMKNQAPQNAVSFAIFESHTPFDTDLSDYRNRQFGAHQKEHIEALARALIFPGDQFADVLKTMAQIKDAKDGLPRSQIYGILRKVRDEGGYFSENALSCAAESLRRYQVHAGATRDISSKDAILPVLGDEKRRLALDLALIADLWDYVDPFPFALSALAEQGKAQ